METAATTEREFETIAFVVRPGGTLFSVRFRGVFAAAESAFVAE